MTALALIAALGLFQPAATAQDSQVPDQTSSRVTSTDNKAESDRIWADFQKYYGSQDYAGAYDVARRAEAHFAGMGEDYLAANYALAAAKCDAALNEWQRLDEDYGGRKSALLRTLTEVQGEELIGLLMDARGALGDRSGQDRLAAELTGRTTKRDGGRGEAALGSRLRIAYSLMQSGRVDEGAKGLRTALRDAAGTDHDSFTIANYTDAAETYRQNRDDATAKALFEEALATPAAKRNPLPPEIADLYLRYAMLLSDTGKIEEAVPQYIRATTAYSQAYGPESAEFLYANDKLAVALSASGSPASSTNIAAGNYRLAMKALGDKEPMTWKFANNYADMLRLIGAPARAQELDAYVLSKRTAYYGENNFNTLVSANNNGQNYLDLADYPTARTFFEQNRSIAVALNLQDADYVAQADAWIFVTDTLSGAVPIDASALSRLESIIGDAHYPDILRIKAAEKAAGEHERKGDFAGGLPLREQAYGVSKAAFTANHPSSFGIRLNIANAKLAAGDRKAAAAEFDGLDKAMLPWMNREVGTAGDRAVAEAVRAIADNMLHDYATLAIRDEAVVPAFADAIARWRSMDDGKRARLRQIAMVVPKDDTETHRQIDVALRLNGEIRELLSAGDVDNLAQSILERLHALDETLNERLAKIPGLDPDALPALPTPAELVGKDGAFINYFVARRWKADRQSVDPYEDIVLYAAVIRSGHSAKLVALGDPRSGETKTAQVQLASLRQTRGAVPLPDLAAPLDGAYDKVLKPLEPLLSDVKTLYILPDGPLFAMPFSLMRDADGRRIEDRYEVRLLTRPEALFGLNDRQGLTKDTRAVLAGGLDYGRGAEMGAAALPGTAAEVESVASELRGHVGSVEVLRGDQATEKAVRDEVASAELLHLATHGTYGSEASGGDSGVDTLWQSGIVLSKSGDVRTRTRKEDDNFLYAFEIMDWDLSKVDLLVLSACETGRGDESFVDGLRGLPTAIGVAGAKRSLLTLWPVDDLGTAAFIDRYYQHLAGGMTYVDALRKTRSDAIEGDIPAAASPSVWSAFVMFEN